MRVFAIQLSLTKEKGEAQEPRLTVIMDERDKRAQEPRPIAGNYCCSFKSLHLVVSLPFEDTNPLIRTVANCLRTPV